MEKTLKHLAAIAYGNPLDCIHVDEDIYPDGERVIHGTRVKSPSEIPLWNAVCITKVKENVSPDGGITMEYGFESKVPALKLLLERLDKGQQSEGEMTIVIEHKNVDHTKDDKMIEGQSLSDTAEDQYAERLDEYASENWHLIQPQITYVDPAHDNKITLPHLFTAREYQEPLVHALLPPDGGDPVKRAVEVWHRRGGKDKTVWNCVITRAAIEVGYYLYLFPTQKQAKKAIWMGRGKDKIKFLDHIPKQLIKRINQTEMFVEFVNGSILQLGGSDSYDSYMGSNPILIVFSEWSICNPVAWDYFRPILVENDGIAIFVYTPRGRNHGYTTYKQALRNSRTDPGRTHCQLLSYKQTGVLTDEQVRREVEEEGMSEQKAAQEFECSFDAQIEGAIFGKEIQLGYAESRISFVPIDKALPVLTAWDLGRSDHNAVWFCQVNGKEIRLVHFYQNRLKGMDHYINYIRTWAEKNEVALYPQHIGPHDLNVSEYSSNRKRIDIAQEDHHFNFKAVGRTNEEDGLSAIRKIFPRLFIDEIECASGLACIQELRFETTKADEDKSDDMQKSYNNVPGPKWASHAGKALQYLAQGLDGTYQAGYVDPLRSLANANPDWSVFD